MSEFDIQRQQRLEKIAALREKGTNPYPNDFRPSMRIPEVLEKYHDCQDESPSTEIIAIAGRLMAKRGHGKTCFAHLLGEGARIQIYVRRDILGEEVFGRSGIWIWEI